VVDIRGSLPTQALIEFFLIWDILHEFQLTLDVSDQHQWTPSNIGIYSCKSAYERFFLGVVMFEPV
jgi:hypothetical protein